VATVAVIVVNHNRAELLVDCLDSLVRQTYRDFEVVVVDNASSDASLEQASRYPDPRVRVLALDRNHGFAGGCNQGIRASQSELVALLNNDAVADPGWLEALVDGLDDPSVGMCASKILFWDSHLIDKAGHLIFWDGQNRGRGTGESDGPRFNQPGECLFPDGCAGLYRRRLIDEVGGFDEDFFAYADDADLGMRAQLAGWRAVYCPAAIVYHRHSSTLGSFSAQKVFWVERNRLWLAVKCLPLPLLLLSPVFTLYRFCWYLVSLLFRRGSVARYCESDSAVNLARVTLRAIVDGLRGVPRMWRKRALIRSQRRISDRQMYRLLWKFRISARELAFNER